MSTNKFNIVFTMHLKEFQPNNKLCTAPWTRDESIFKNIPNVLDDRADGPNKVWTIWGIFGCNLSKKKIIIMI